MAKMLANVEDVVTDLSDIKGARIVVITTKTVPAMIGGSPFTDCFKISHIQGIINFDYAASVNRQRVKEGKVADFKPVERKWGTKLPKLPFVTHDKDGAVKLYLQIRVDKSLDHWYEDAAGNRLDTEAVEKWLRPKSPSRQGVDKETILRTYDMANILAIKGIESGTTHVIDGNLRLIQDIAAIR